MKIDEVITNAIVAIFSSPLLQQHLILKGGTALRLNAAIDTRMSLDIDFSTALSIGDPEAFFGEMENSLQNHFHQLGFDVIDTRFSKRPRRSKADREGVWGGWVFTFKLSAGSDQDRTLAKRIRRAIIPEGSSSSKIEIQLSEYEYCEIIEQIEIQGVAVTVYTLELILLEKLRAICQQHPNYPFSLNKNRARDFFDIHSILEIFRNEPAFILELASHIDPVFMAKQVPMTILTNGEIFDPDFLDGQGHGFLSVRDTVKGKTESFSFYVEQLKILVGLILDAREKIK